MTITMRAIYRDGAFVPVVPCGLPENAEVELEIHSQSIVSAVVTDPEERAAIIRRLTDRMRRHPLPPDAPKLTREQMHERR